MAEARDAGMDRAGMESMVTDTYNAHQVNGAEPTGDGKRIYDTLPDGLIDLPSACRKYGVNSQTANGWMRKGMIPLMGKLRAPARGGGYNITSERSFKECMSSPKKLGGRPRKPA